MLVLTVTELNATGWTLTSLATLLTLGRFWNRRRKTDRFGWDDAFNAAALTFLLAFMIGCQLFVPGVYQSNLYALGFSSHRASRKDPVVDNNLDMWTVLVYHCTLYSVKASFLALHCRLFALPEMFMISWSLVTGFIAVSFLTTFLSFFWRCGSPATLLDLDACANTPTSQQNAIVILWCALNVVGDIMLMALPCLMLNVLQLAVSKKIGLALLFSVTFLTIAFNIVRVVNSVNSWKTANMLDNILWSVLEPNVAVIVCTLPCYRNYLASLSSAMFGSLPSSLHDSRSNVSTERRLVSQSSSEAQADADAEAEAEAPNGPIS